LPIFGEKNGVLLENQCYDQLWSKTSSILSKIRHFFGKCFGEIKKNHNIGPWKKWGGKLVKVFLKGMPTTSLHSIKTMCSKGFPGRHREASVVNGLESILQNFISTQKI
jgi:hypothetical protein